MKAGGEPRYELELRRPGEGAGEAAVSRVWGAAELEKGVPWLKAMNAQGHDIYIRPAGDHGLVLLGGLQEADIGLLKSDGFAPAAVVRSRPGEYEAWIKLAEGPVPAAVLEAAKLGLVRRVAGGRVDAGVGVGQASYGRLAGFTNRDPALALEDQGGRNPYVLVQESTGAVAASGEAYLERAQQALDQAAAGKERERRLRALLQGVRGESGQSAAGGSKGKLDAVLEYRRQGHQILARYGVATDPVRMDWMIAVDMAKSGRYSAQEIERGIFEGSPHIDVRKPGQVAEYAKRTAQKAWQAPEAVQQRQAEMLRQEPVRGQGRVQGQGAPRPGPDGRGR
jgi:hypothetical protein